MDRLTIFFAVISIMSIANGAEMMAYRVTQYRSIWTYSFNSEMVPEFIEGAVVGFRFVGLLKNVTKVAMTSSTTDCTVLQEGTISDVSLKSDQEATTAITMPNLLQKSQILYFCFKVSQNTWSHQGNEDWAYVIVEQRLLSLPLIILMIIVCVCLSGLLNGLVLGLMSLDITELKVIANAGGEKEKKYGKAILSVRKTGNFLLISLVVGATSLNSTVTVLIDSFVSEWMTVLIVTLTIVLFCEIIPNSIVSRFALTIGAKTIYLTWMVMIITSPISYPLGKLLDKVLGEDIPNLTRERLKELVKITANISALKKTEIDMISGALEMSAKKVEDIMTLLEDVYSIPIETLLDYESIREIIASGYSRIPIYEGEKSNIVKIMYVRDLALIDPEDKTPLALFSKLMADQEMIYFDEGTTIDAVFNIFKEGVHGHMAFVVKRRNENEVGPPVVTGLLTLEDIIEEIVQVEIVDEYDVIVDNRSKRKRQRYRMISDYMTVFADNFESKNVLISPNLRVAALNFLASELKEFSPDVISPKVMQRLLRQGIIVHLPKKKPKSVNPLIFSQVLFELEQTPECFMNNNKYSMTEFVNPPYVFMKLLFPGWLQYLLDLGISWGSKRSQAHEGFVMILEGRAQIVIGPDNLRCECGPFSYFGLGILSDTLDDKMMYGFAVEAIGEVRYLKIPRELYQAALEATQMEKGKTGNVPYPYRGLLADDDDRELGDSSKSAHFAEAKVSSKSGKDDSKVFVSFQNQPRSGESSKRSSNASSKLPDSNETSPTKPALRRRSADGSQPPPSSLEPPVAPKVDEQPLPPKADASLLPAPEDQIPGPSSKPDTAGESEDGKDKDTPGPSSKPDTVRESEDGKDKDTPGPSSRPDTVGKSEDGKDKDTPAQDSPPEDDSELPKSAHSQ